MMEIVVHNDLVFEFTRVAPITFFFRYLAGTLRVDFTQGTRQGVTGSW